MGSRSRHRSQSAERSRRHHRDSSADADRSDYRNDRKYKYRGGSRDTDDFRSRSSRYYDKGGRRDRNDRYGNDERYYKYSRGYPESRNRSDDRRYRDGGERVNGRSIETTTEGHQSRSERNSSRQEDHRDRYGKRYRKEDRRSASVDSTCSFGSQVSFGEERVEEHNTEELDEESLLMKAMGFGEFSTTKNKEHTDSDASGVAKRSKRQYRQYMNRRGGFNRPLSPTF